MPNCLAAWLSKHAKKYIVMLPAKFPLAKFCFIIFQNEVPILMNANHGKMTKKIFYKLNEKTGKIIFPKVIFLEIIFTLHHD